MASGDRKVEKELTRREFRTKLEGESRRDLQSLAKQYCIPANLKSNELIDQILYMEYDDCLEDDARPYQTRDAPPYQTETMEAVRSLMKRISEKSSIESGAKCIFDCVVKVEAEMSACAFKRAAKVPTCAVKPAAIDLKVPPTVSSCATAVKAVQQVNKAASECQQREELFAPTVTAPLVSLPKTTAQVPSAYKYKPKTSAQMPSACAESPPECALVTNGKEAMRPSNTVPAPATGAVVQQVVIGVSVKTDKPVDVKLEPGTSEPSMACTSFCGGYSQDDDQRSTSSKVRTQDEN